MHLEAEEWEHYPAIFTPLMRRDVSVVDEGMSCWAGDGQRDSTAENGLSTWRPGSGSTTHLAILTPVTRLALVSLAMQPMFVRVVARCCCQSSIRH
jgi:hypothetical protein